MVKPSVMKLSKEVLIAKFIRTLMWSHLSTGREKCKKSSTSSPRVLVRTLWSNSLKDRYLRVATSPASSRVWIKWIWASLLLSKQLTSGPWVGSKVPASSQSWTTLTPNLSLAVEVLYLENSCKCCSLPSPGWATSNKKLLQDLD